MEKIDVVITSYNRPKNIHQIIDAFRASSIPTRIILVDAGGWPYSTEDERIGLSRNYGPYNRFLATPILQSEYVFFSDDDYCVGPMFLKTMFEIAVSNPSIGVLGQIGRLVAADGTYNFKNIQDMYSQVDIVVRGYFVKSGLVRAFMSEPQELPLFEDDLALCCFARRAGFQIGISNNFSNRDRHMIHTELPEYGQALSSRPQHLLVRTEYLKRQIRTTSWRPLASE